MATFAKDSNEPLFDYPRKSSDQIIELLRKHVEIGARGLKILSELGLKYKDATGRLIKIDDPELSDKSAGILESFLSMGKGSLIFIFLRIKVSQQRSPSVY